MLVVAAALLGLIALLATLQYRWLGQISADERERMKTNLSARATAFARDFDREVTRAYLTFQLDPLQEGDNLAGRIAERYDHWQGRSPYPRLVKEIYLVTGDADGAAEIQRFNLGTRFIEPATWPAALEPVRASIEKREPSPGSDTVVIRTMAPVVWASVPAVLVPAPVLMFNSLSTVTLRPTVGELRVRPRMRHAVLVLDREYLTGEMLPSLARQHFRGASDGIDYHLAVTGEAGEPTVYSTSPEFSPVAAASADAAADMFQVRVQEFGELRAEVRRFTSFVARSSLPSSSSSSPTTGKPASRMAEIRGVMVGAEPGAHAGGEQSPLSIVLQHGPSAADRKALEAGMATATAQTFRSAVAIAPPHWRLVVKHPSGSLEAAVTSVRRRNLLVSSGILGVLGVSIGFLVVSTRRAQDLARQQMEFVAAVSHELRTPLAVIKSAADNLAEGVVHEDPRVRKYGELVRGEGRRLTEMVEQILELAGIHSGQRGFALAPVPVAALLRDVVDASSTLVEEAALTVEYDVPESIPAVLGDEQALRRVFQNLVGNAIKYGADGGWIGVRARSSGREVVVTVADRGIGIEPAEQARIFEPFYRAPGVIAAQINGAGLGLSLVQRIVEAHGGRITVRSATGTGSEFAVHLPAASEEIAPRTSSAPGTAPSLHHS